MNKLIRSNLLIVVAAVIVTFYGYSEYKKHQFDFEKMTGVDFVSTFVVIVTFVIIMIITYKTSKRNEVLYAYLQNEIEQLHGNAVQNETFQSIRNQYQALVVDEYSNVNIPSFLESFMASYKFNSKITIPKELKILQANTSTPILIGVLGTFTGLVMALSQLEIGDMSESLNLQPILSGVGTAFYTSIAGVLFSILLGIHLRHFNSDQLFIQYMLKIENLLYREGKNRSDQKVVDTLVTVREEIVNMRHSFSEVSNFSREFKNASVNLQEFNKDFSTNITDMKTIFESTKDVMQLFNNRTAQFHEDFERLFDYFKKNEAQHEALTSRQAEINEQLQQTFATNHQFQENAVSHLDQIHVAFTDSIENQFTQLNKSATVMETIADNIHTQFDQVIGSQTELLEAQSKIEEANVKQIDTVEKATVAIKEVLENNNFENLTEASALFAQSTGDVQRVIQQFVNTYKEMQGSSKVHYDALATVTEKLDTLMDNQISASKEQKQELQKTMQLITTYQENLQQAVIRFLNNDFDYDKLRKILDEVRENMEIQNQFLIKQLSAFQGMLVHPQAPMQATQQPLTSNPEMVR